MSDDGIRRTRKMMMSRPEMVEHLTYKHWLHIGGRPDDAVERAAFADLPEERKQELRLAMWEAMEAYWALSPEEKRAEADASLRRTLAENDAHFAVEILPHLERKIASVLTAANPQEDETDAR